MRYAMTLLLCMYLLPSVAIAQCPEPMILGALELFEGFGYAADRAGDVNGDGFDDIIVGARFSDAAGPSSGRAYVFSGYDGSLLHTFAGEQAFDDFGISVSGAGDVDGDGYDDVVVGTLDQGIGHAYIYSGQTGALLRRHSGTFESYFALRVSGAGDVNGDGLDDVIVGAPQDDAGGESAGRAFVYSGCSGVILHTFTGSTPGDGLGIGVAGVGDVDGDGASDILIGAHRVAGVGDQAGMAYLFSGGTGDTLFTFSGEAADDLFGFVVAGPGDVDGDGTPDLLISAIGDDIPGSDPGIAYAYSGATGNLIHRIEGTTGDEYFAWFLSGAGDVDGDGYADIVVGAHRNHSGGSNAGRAYVYSGATGALMWTFTGEANDQLGRAVASAGDLNFDGYDDVLIGAHGSDAGGIDGGAVSAYLSCPVEIDILPNQCPNVLNETASIPYPNPLAARANPSPPVSVALLGSSALDVTDVDPSSLLLNGIPPLRHTIRDVGGTTPSIEMPCECNHGGTDGYADLMLQYDRDIILGLLGEAATGTDQPLTLTAHTHSGRILHGADCVRVGRLSLSADNTVDRSRDLVRSVTVSPNPFNAATSISYVLSRPGVVSIAVYDILGRRIITLWDGYQSTGHHSVTWHGDDGQGREVASGMYLYRLQNGDATATQKMLLLK